MVGTSGAGAVWQRARFGTVRPRVQIPGPRPISEYDPGVTAHAAMAMDHSWITISRGGARTSRLHWRIWERDWIATSTERLVSRSGIRATGHAGRIPKGLAKRRTCCGGWTLSYYGLVLYSAAWPVNAFRSSTSHASRLDRNRRPVSMTVEL